MKILNSIMMAQLNLFKNKLNIRKMDFSKFAKEERFYTIVPKDTPIFGHVYSRFFYKKKNPKKIVLIPFETSIEKDKPYVITRLCDFAEDVCIHIPRNSFTNDLKIQLFVDEIEIPLDRKTTADKVVFISSSEILPLFLTAYSETKIISNIDAQLTFFYGLIMDNKDKSKIQVFEDENFKVVNGMVTSLSH